MSLAAATMSNPHELLPWIAALDERLRPIAKRPVDINQPGWQQRLAERPHPLDEAGVRQEAASVLDEFCGGLDEARPEPSRVCRSPTNPNPLPSRLVLLVFIC